VIPFEEAYRLAMDNAFPLPAERVGLNDSQGRVLAEDIFSDMPMPPFNKSAVDGFACRFEDIHMELEVVETIPAGKVPQKAIVKGQCSRIMTGAMLPEGADGVLMVEDVEELPGGRIRFRKKESWKNVCYLGEDIRPGEKLLQKGTLVSPQHIAVMAAVGAVNPLVIVSPRIGILSTGDELVEPDVTPGTSQIRNSNACQLIAQVSRASSLPSYYGIAPDEKNFLRDKINDSLETSDVVLLTGGVSMGNFDHVPTVLQELGFSIVFKSIAIQPGRPTVLARRDNRIIFGLPGNPVSSFVLFEILVRPFLMKMMGCDWIPRYQRLTLGADISRRNTTRRSLMPVKVVDGVAFPLEYHGSAHINAYTEADGLVSFAIGETIIKQGDLVDVRQI
jgi:molybdopterin molybdotransferase